MSPCTGLRGHGGWGEGEMVPLSKCRLVTLVTS